MVGFLEVLNSVSGVVTALCAALGLFFLARQNGLLRQQLARPDPIVSAEAHKVPAWEGGVWSVLTVDVRNPSNVPLHVLGIEIAAPGQARLWPAADLYVADLAGGKVRRKQAPPGDGHPRLPLDFEVAPADSDPQKPGPRRRYCEIILRRPADTQPMPSLRLTCRWKTTRATTMAIVADIWDSDATV